MKLLNSYGPCRGLTLFSIGGRTLELWYCPAGYEIPRHRHPNMLIELFFLFGNNTKMFRKSILDSNYPGPNDSAVCKWPLHMFRRFTIQNHHIHWFQVSKWPLIFLNYERWIGDDPEPKSASEDFELEVNYADK